MIEVIVGSIESMPIVVNYKVVTLSKSWHYQRFCNKKAMTTEIQSTGASPMVRSMLVD